MRRMLSAVLVLGVVGLSACDSAPEADVAGPVMAAGGNGGGKSVVASGAGHITVGDEWRNFSFHAQRSADGEVTGTWQHNNRDVDLRTHGEVRCIRVVGNVAYVGLYITSSSEPVGVPPLITRFGIMQTVDNGEGAKAAPDQISLIASVPEQVFNDYCAGTFLGFPPPLRPVESGNIQIR